MPGRKNGCLLFATFVHLNTIAGFLRMKRGRASALPARLRSTLFPLLLCIPRAHRQVSPFFHFVVVALREWSGIWGLRGTSCFVRNDPLAMGDTERLQRGGGMVVGAGMAPKALTSSIFSCYLTISRSNFFVESSAENPYSAQNLLGEKKETS